MIISRRETDAVKTPTPDHGHYHCLPSEKQYAESACSKRYDFISNMVAVICLVNVGYYVLTVQIQGIVSFKKIRQLRGYMTASTHKPLVTRGFG